ncbi:MAG TPA: hypothetical protein ENN57_02410 [Chloroflexi bacterium]|nr:hypothetical protein [Chloroflexota bacterium]
MQHVEPSLPKDVRIDYSSPAPTRAGIIDSFYIRLGGRYIDLRITASLISMSMIQTLKSGPVPIFDTMYIRHYWEEQLLPKLPSLRKIVFHVEIEAQAKLRFGIARKLEYLDWADELANKVTTSGQMGSFDFIEFKKNRMERLLLNIYEDSRETNEMVKKINEQYRSH